MADLTNFNIWRNKKFSIYLPLYPIHFNCRLCNITCFNPLFDTSDIKINDKQIFLSRNSFAYIYNAGGIPCKIDHGSINNKIKWNMGVDVSDLPFDPILVTCFDGLIEEKHPYNFIAKAVIK